MELTLCQAYPWNCVSRIPLVFIPYLIAGVIIGFLFYIIIRVAHKKIKLIKLLLIGIIFVFLVTYFYQILRLIKKDFSLIIKPSVLSCVARMAPDECFEYEAISEATRYPADYKSSLKLCNLVFEPSSCKMNICNNLDLKNLIIECRNFVAKTCPNGYILDNLPCACNVPAGPYAVYDKKWKKDYWEKYRKNDKFDYCCNGQQQKNPC